MTRSRRLGLFAAVLAGVVLLLYDGSRFAVGGEITHFLPDSDDRARARIAEALTRAEVARTIVLTVETRDQDRTRQATARLADRLARDGAVAWVRSGIDEQEERAFFDLYLPRRLGFLADSPEAARRALEDEALRTRVARLRDVLGSPLGSVVRPIAPEDPLLVTFDRLGMIRRQAQASLRVVDGTFFTDDGRYGVIFLATRHSPFEGAASTAFLARLDEAIASLRGEYGPSLLVEKSGLAAFAVAAERSMRADIQRIAILSSVGIGALLVVFFGSLRFLVLGALPLLFGMLGGLAATLFVFGRVHGVTLAFGASLLGVAIDYVQHYVAHELLAPHPRGRTEGMRRLWPALLLGGVSTALGLFGFFFSSVPGIREMAVFAVVGIAVALAATRFFLPLLLPTRARSTVALRFFHRAFRRLLTTFRTRRILPWAIVSFALFLSALGLPRLRWVDDPSALTLLDPSVLAEDRRVQGRIGARDPSKFVVVTDADEDRAIEKNVEVARRLEAAKERGALEGYASLASWLPSARTQREVDALVRNAGLDERLPPLFAAAGFHADSFQPFFDSLHANPPEPLVPSDLARSPFAPLLAPHLLEVEGELAVVTTLEGVHDFPAIEASLADVPGALVLDQRRFFTDAYRAFRERALELTIVGGILVLFLVFGWHRRARPTLAVMLPALLAAATSIAILSLLGVPHNPMNLLALLLVLAMGVDHGIFLAGHVDDDDAMATTWLGNTLSMITTVLSFGLLSMSGHPALSALGWTTSLGVFSSFLLAPAVAILLRPEARL